jgi:hypothetical protein
VIESVVRMRFRRLSFERVLINPWLMAERDWTGMNQVAMRFLQRIPPERWMRLRYEELLQDPEEAMARVTAFLGVEPCSALHQVYDGNEARGIAFVGDPSISRRSGLDTKLVNAWRKSPPPQTFSPVTIETALQLGYDAA